MFKHFKTFLIVCLAFQASLDQANGQLTGVSWLFRGTAQQNNTVLTFNMYDTLNLACRAAGVDAKYYLTFALTKGSSAPTMMTVDTSGDYYTLSIDNPGTVVWDDFNGFQPGFENIIIIGDVETENSYYAQYGFRYINIGTLRTSDSGTYHCSVIYDEGGDVENYGTSGALTIQVNTKADQAHSSRAKVSGILTYSAVIMGASKLFF